MHDRQRLPHPINDRTRIALRTILTWIDERAATQKQAAAAFAKVEQYDDAAEADALASAYRSTADFIRELAGDVTPPGRFVRIHVSDLAKLLAEQPLDAQPSENSGEFDDDLVQRLAVAAFKSIAEHDETLGKILDPWDVQSKEVRNRMYAAARAVLGELAKASVELPTDEQVQIAAYDIGNSDGVMTLEAAGGRVAALFRYRVAHAIAAKDARIDELQRMLTGAHGDADAARDELARVVKERDELAEANRDVNATAEQLIARINELETHTPANSCSDFERAQYELTVEQQRKRIAELENQLVAGANEIELPTNHECVEAYEHQRSISSASGLNRTGGISFQELHQAGICGVLGKVREKLAPFMAARKLKLLEAQQSIAELEDKYSDAYTRNVSDLATISRVETERDAAYAKIAELEKRLAELTAPIDADEQTPGELLITLQHGNIRGISKGILESAEHEANAILRVFGKKMVRQALGRVREQMWADKIEIPFGDGSKRLFVRAESVVRIIDDEIATIEASKPAEKADVAVREVLDRMTAPKADHAHELGSCSFCGKQS